MMKIKGVPCVPNGHMDIVAKMSDFQTSHAFGAFGCTHLCHSPWVCERSQEMPLRDSENLFKCGTGVRAPFQK